MESFVLAIKSEERRGESRTRLLDGAPVLLSDWEKSVVKWVFRKLVGSVELLLDILLDVLLSDLCLSNLASFCRIYLNQYSLLCGIKSFEPWFFSERFTFDYFVLSWFRRANYSLLDTFIIS